SRCCSSGAGRVARSWNWWAAARRAVDVGPPAAFMGDKVPPRWHVVSHERRAPGRLSLADREESGVALAAGGGSLTAIAVQLGRATSTISHEVSHNGGR